MSDPSRSSFTIPGTLYIQNGVQFVSFCLPHSRGRLLSFVEEYTEANPLGDQRIKRKAHVEQFADAIDRNAATRPQSLVGTLVNGAEVVPPDGFDIRNDINPVIVKFPSQKGKFIQIHDGQHGLSAVDHKSNRDVASHWVWLMSCMVDGTPAERQALHTDINYHGDRENKAIVAHQMFQSKRLPEDEQAVGALFDRLNLDVLSVLHRRVKCFNGQKATHGKMLGFKDYVERSTSIFRHRQVSEMNPEVLYELVRAYYNIWAQTNKDLWNDHTAYLISDLMGLKIITRVMDLVFEKAIKKYKTLTVESVRKVIESTSHAMPQKFWLKQVGKDKWSWKTESGKYAEVKKKIGFRTPKTKTV